MTGVSVGMCVLLYFDGKVILFVRLITVAVVSCDLGDPVVTFLRARSMMTSHTVSVCAGGCVHARDYNSPGKSENF